MMTASSASGSPDSGEKNPIQVAGRLFGALELLADRGSLGLIEITEILGLNKSTAHRVLASLEYLGYVRQNSKGQYELTFRIVEQANKLLDHTDIIAQVHPFLQNLMQESGETVHFVRQEGTDAVYIDKVNSTSGSIQMVSRIGSRIPLYCSGVGKAILARLPEDEVRQIWAQSRIVPVTPHTIVDYERLRHVLASVRRDGFARDDEENEIGVRCVAAALDLPLQKDRYAFSISAPTSRMSDQRVKELGEMALQTRTAIEQYLR